MSSGNVDSETRAQYRIRGGRMCPACKSNAVVMREMLPEDEKAKECFRVRVKNGCLKCGSEWVATYHLSHFSDLRVVRSHEGADCRGAGTLRDFSAWCSVVSHEYYEYCSLTIRDLPKFDEALRASEFPLWDLFSNSWAHVDVAEQLYLHARKVYDAQFPLVSEG